MADPTLQVEFIGGHPCLDYTNSLRGRLGESPVDPLRDYTHLVEWARSAGLLSAAEALRLRGERAARPDLAGSVLERAIALREELYGVLSAVARGEAPPPGSLPALNAELVEANSHFELVFESGAFRWRPDEVGSLLVPLWTLARSASELLSSESLSLLRECDAESCSWLFLDGTRNRSRRWCDTKVCGNRERVRRHYWRQRRAEAGAGDADDEHDSGGS